MASIRMVINSDKTELVVFSRDGNESLEPSNGIKSKRSIKALGFQLSSNLKWDEHVDTILSKTAYIIKLVKHLKKWLNIDDCLKVATSKYFGLAYYGAALWMTPGLSSNLWKRLASQHYRAMRASLGD